ncbi:MAG: phage terminase large subunit family protein [Victivallaceae bacterium]|nr:phage terminase large subunit family protein [Victivallaceae bacterium]
MPQINPSSMRPVEVARLINSTEFGFVLPQARIYRDFNRAGFRIAASGNPRNVNLLKYIAWMHDYRHTPREETSARSYEQRREAERRRQAEQSQSGRNIGPLPEIIDPERKADCERNFRLFCECYFPETYSLPWSPDHLKAIARIEQAVLLGGLYALAMSRGSGKSTITETACLWAMLYGHRDFVVLISATETAALEMLESIKTEFMRNELLAEDFPEAVFPILCLGGIANRCAGQLYRGKRTMISWTANEIVLPTVEGSKASGAIIRVAGITGRIRGMKFKRPDKATPVRPSLVIIDDPQTSESASSHEQTRKRVRVLSGDVLGLAGPGQKISGIMPCTVIRPGDMADQILDKKTHPDWNGERTKMVYKFPENQKLWEKYADIRADCLREKGDFSDATEFYREHREEMDKGAIVSWEARYNHDELSAIQHAMNLKFQDEAAFFAEYQNEPMPEDLNEDAIMSAGEIAAKLNNMKRGEIPVGATFLTLFIDVQKELLYYLVAAWEECFSGYVVDYGVYPEQRRKYFLLRDAHPTLQDAAPGSGLEGSVYAGLEALTDELLSREWPRDDGAMMKVDRCLIDANWGQTTDVIYQFCRQSTHAAVLLPSHGRYIGAGSKPMNEYRKQPGDRIGHNWMIPNVRGKRAIRHALFDANYWKSFIHARFAVAMGDKSCLSLFGNQPATHQLLSEHLTAEYRTRTEGRGRKVDEWKIRPDASDNHWLDCLVGCAVTASMLGAALPEFGNAGKPLRPRKRIDLGSYQRGQFNPASGRRKIMTPSTPRKML